MNTYASGKTTALACLGLVKAASPVDLPHVEALLGQSPTPGAARPYVGADGRPRGFWGSVASHSLAQLFGAPGKLWNELRTGDWRGPDSYLRRTLWPVPEHTPGAGRMAQLADILSPSVNYIPAALSIYAATQAPEGSRGETTGSATGSLVGTILGSPLGLMGTTAGTLVGRTVGSAVGRNLDELMAD